NKFKESFILTQTILQSPFILGKENAFVKPVPLEYRVKLSYGTTSLNSNHKIQIKDFYNFFKLNLQ
ncbi:hypothetical protein, partial [uncultured Lactobacillus sp.]|uniref:hypothetical protein n=1 Tax=uncultured Lactobacillus sp. TaxID=153152 RepID=UPI0028E71BD8